MNANRERPESALLLDFVPRSNAPEERPDLAHNADPGIDREGRYRR